MKSSFLIFLIIIQITTFGQSTSIDKIVIKKEEPNNIKDSTIVSFSAKYPGGDKEMYKFISKNVKYPEKARLAGKEGIIYLNFMVEVDGTLSDIKILKGISGCSECSDEVIRVVKLMPKWLPAFKENKIIRTQYNLPIRFSL